jgi:RNA polymerase sigma factor (sigma-70 family)
MNILRNIRQLTDLELIESYRESSDNTYVGILFERYSHLVFCVSMKYLRDEDESKDAVMQIFEKLLKDLLKHDIKNFKSWLHTVSKNHCLMKLRNKPKEISGLDYMFVESEASAHPSTENGDETVLKESELIHLEKSIVKLDHQQRICIELFYLQQMSYQQVTEQTGFSMNQVKSFIQNGKRNLKNLMNNHE